MKKKLLFVICALTVLLIAAVSASAATVTIDSTAFPDAVFCGYVSDNLDTNHDGSLSDDEITEVRSIDVHHSGITSLEGLELFTELTDLNCANNNLTMLDVSRNTKLTYLDCAANQLTSLNVEKNVLLYNLNCTRNELTSLDVSKNTELTYLKCSGNQLLSLNVSSLPELTRLAVNDNSLTSLILSANSELHSLQCDHNCLTELDISGTQIFISPETLWGTFGNQMNDAPIIVSMTPEQRSFFDNLYKFMYDNANVIVNEVDGRFPDAFFRAYVYDHFDTNFNGILSDSEIGAVTRIDVKNMSGITSLKGVELFTKLTYLDCAGNQLTSLNVEKNVLLYHLDCTDNALSSLDVSKNTQLRYLACGWNQLISLDISDLPLLTYLNVNNNSLTSLNLSGNPQLHSFQCYSNFLTEVDISCTQIFVSPDTYMGHFGIQKNQGTIIVTMTAAQSSKYKARYESSYNNARVTVRPADERFSDPIFRTYVYNNFDTNGDGTLSDSEIAAVKDLYVSDMGLTSLKGVDLFTNLTDLDCARNQLTSLDISKLSMLEQLSVYDNSLTSLNLSGNPQLHSLYCDHNYLTALDISDTQIFVSPDTEWGDFGNQKNSGEITVTMTAAQRIVYDVSYASSSDNVRVYITVKASNELRAPAGLTEIGEEAFANTAFTEVYLPDGVMTIGANAFKNCGKLEYIEIPGTVTSIADNAFDGCGRLVIAGEAGSTAETFATAHDLVFININSLY